ncbi:MAG TPA: CDP-diacylglycerol--glycerol-3-phosphate 3-phosphatidyltransferase [Gammaproteobacteria bacterium]|jgi:CDP-diacylglycerol--glycerol-3-phosphate 3-phosphatidyltransferase|nr:CDP-diacylglycerol--glycerol-3-phosphate 3-phosphatidyltransferase [Gammaproteobacteria bacterium]|tara:strand:- start:1579 stop:2148 length:570 start_codon:yes stop_codon:yes gene_type:complete
MSLKSNIANILTLIRIACIPLMVFVFFSNMENARPLSAIIFIVAALTDWLDGWVAREFDQSSKLGAFLDPVADKLIVCIALLMIVQSDPTVINTLISIVIIGREISISALREWMAELGERHQVSVIAFSKLKTILQMVGLSCMLYQESLFAIDIYTTGMIALIVASILTVWTMVIYLVKAWPYLQGGID